MQSEQEHGLSRPGKIGRDRKGETKGQNEQQHGISLVLGEMVGNRNGKIERAE